MMYKKIKGKIPAADMISKCSECKDPLSPEKTFFLWVISIGNKKSNILPLDKKLYQRFNLITREPSLKELEKLKKKNIMYIKQHKTERKNKIFLKFILTNVFFK